MPWDPKPQPAQQMPPLQMTPVPAPSNGLPGNPYAVGYENSAPQPTNGASRSIKNEASTDSQYAHGLPAMNSYSQIGPNEGGANRAHQLVQQQYGAQAAANMQRGSGLALPGQQAKPQGLQMPTQNQQQYAQQHYAATQQQHAMRQQHQLQQQQQNPRIKVENNSPQLSQGQFQQQQQRQPAPTYGQTDGADEALEEWQAMIMQRRAATAVDMERANHMMRDQVAALSDELSSGLMLPLDEQRARLNSRKRRVVRARNARSTPVGFAGPSIAQLDGDVDDDSKDFVKGEEDEDAINSDLDDSDEEANDIDQSDDENIDTILCTYDKVQRVKNKWKCVLKDGVLHTGGKEYIFHKGNGEFEW
jgi:transcription initiation factor TFIIA large subunit